jgi:hypothetical protein
MILPPILCNHGYKLKEALEDYLGLECVKKVTVEEQVTHVTFKPVPVTEKLKQFIRELTEEVVIVHEGRTYTIQSEYLDL